MARNLIQRVCAAALTAVVLFGALPAAAEDFKQDFALWQLFCADKPAEGTPACEIRQLLKNQQNQFVAGLFYTEVGNRGVFMLRVTPALDDKLKAGVMFQADSGFGTDAVKYAGCDQLGCVAQLPMKRVVVAILAQANLLDVKVGTKDSKPYPITFRLDGFQAALDGMRARAN